MFNNVLDFIAQAENWVFTIFALFAIGGAIFMINFQKVIHMVVSLALTFISLAGMYVMLYAEFIAFVQVLIYAGAISILMIFGIMMTKHTESEVQDTKKIWHDISALVGCFALLGMIFYAVQTTTYESVELQAPANNTLEIGKTLFTKFAIPFEIMSVLLTVAFIGAIVIAKREEE
jgi:NADH-quinone oxidoreductase subunit J